MASSLNERRYLVVDLDKCIGCEACANVCSPGLITVTDEGLRRILRVALECDEDCVRCAEACPEEAIVLTTTPEAIPVEEYLTAVFDLFPCERCGAPFTTRRVVDKLLTIVPQEIGAEPIALEWLRLCPLCRQTLEGESVVAEPVFRSLAGE